MKLILPPKQQELEEPIEDVSFHIHKLSKREKPTDYRRRLICAAFSEFGCEIVGALYCIPRLFQEHPGLYKIVVGWHGRKYLYQHLADEFWEMKEEHQHLRDYARAFHHVSRNLQRIEKKLTEQGQVVSSGQLGNYAAVNKCWVCGSRWRNVIYDKACPKCQSEDIERALFADVKYWKPRATRLPQSSKEKLAEVKQYLKPNLVGIFARGRKTYARNLQPEFYCKLIAKLEEMGYNPIWLGEKQSCQPCPVDHIHDFSRDPEARDLEKTLAIISQCKFTFQAFTASTRLAGLMGVPYILFESPDQVWVGGQEGFRRNLCDFGPSKLAACHYLSVYENTDAAIELAERCIEEIMAGNSDDIMGLVENPEAVARMRSENIARIGSI